MSPKKNTENNKRIAKNTLILYVRMFFTMAISLYTTRAILEILGIENYGIYNVVGGIVSLIAFLNIALSNASTRFITYQIGRGEPDMLAKTISACLSIHFMLGLMILLIGLIIGPWYIDNYLVIPTESVHAAKIVFFFSLAYCFINISQIPYTAVIIAHEKMNVYAYVAVIEALLKLAVVYLLLFFPDKQRLTCYALFMFVSQVLTLILYSIYCRLSYKETKYRIFYEKNIYLPIIRFAIMDIYGNLCALGWFQGVSLILNLYFGAIINASYGICNQVISIVNRFVDNYLTAVKPQIVKSYANKDYSYMIDLMYNSSKYSFLLIALVAIPLFSELEFVFNLWLVKVPDYSVNLTKLTLLYLLAVSLLVPINVCIHATGHMKEISFKTGSIYLIAIPILYCSLKYISSPYLAACFSVILQSIAVLINLHILKKYIVEISFKRYFTSVIVPCVSIFGVTISVVLIENFIMDSSWTRFILVSCTSTMVLSCMLYKFALDSTLRSKVNIQLEKWIHQII